MPYRRLPNTDLARIATLRKATSMEGYKENGQLVLSYQTIEDARQLTHRFDALQRQYQQYHDQLVSIGKTYKEEWHMARMYTSHFIQVLNLSIERGELNKKVRSLYGLDPDDARVPRLKLESEVAEWGKKIIQGEEARIKQGGAPIYNPTIAKVKVHYSIFADHYYNMNRLRESSARFLSELQQMRPLVDDLILDLWNQVEAFYADLPLGQHLAKCKPFGLIFYLRTSEKKRIEAESLQGELDF